MVNNHMLEMAIELAGKMAIRVHPELLKQYLHFRYATWLGGMTIQCKQKGVPPPTLLPVEKLQEFVHRYNKEFNDWAKDTLPKERFA